MKYTQKFTGNGCKKKGKEETWVSRRRRGRAGGVGVHDGWRREPSPGREVTAKSGQAFIRPFVHDDYINGSDAITSPFGT